MSPIQPVRRSPKRRSVTVAGLAGSAAAVAAVPGMLSPAPALAIGPYGTCTSRPPSASAPGPTRPVDSCPAGPTYTYSFIESPGYTHTGYFYPY